MAKKRENTKKKKLPRVTRTEPVAPLKAQTAKQFPIVGMGASAGGLEALKALLSHTPGNTGMAFVIVQHLDPQHGSMTAEILGRCTQMPVLEIKNGMRVKPNYVYVIPPNCNLGLTTGAFKILPRSEKRGQFLPVDSFFRELAQDLNTSAIGVVLSGTAFDGTQGLLAIKGDGGITIVQDPKSAKYDGMPRSAIASGSVDLVLTPEAIGEELARIAKDPYVDPKAQPILERPAPKKQEILENIFGLLRNNTGVDFAHYKSSTIQRRLARRMVLNKTDDLAKYLKYIESNPEEINALFADILIHVTGFFRDKKVYDALKSRILPKYFKARDRSLPFRIWVAGCSTGEEAFSLAMTFMEFQEDSTIRTSLQIFATDISEKALQKARAAIYPESIATEISKERLAQFFEKVDSGYRIVKWLRDTVLFSRHDVTRDPPFAKVDLISCRNVLIYFDSELHKRVLPVFHYALNPGGILLLGKSESIGNYSKIFSLADKSNKLYLKKNVTTPLKIQFPVGRYSVDRLGTGAKSANALPGRIDVQREAERIALSQYAPPSVVINGSMEITQSRGRTAPFLELSPGHASLNLLRMAHPELISDLRAAIQAARKKDAPVLRENICIHEGGVARKFAIRVVPISVPAPSSERYFTIFFEDAVTQSPGPNRPSRDTRNFEAKTHAEMQKKISANQEYLQALIEEYETTQDELISSNEEFQSTNEELQSTNEELETAKEELQSANEELTTVNDELQTRNAEMAQLNNDLTNLLASVDIPIVMVGPGGRIRRFTPKAGKALKLIPSDVGRPIGDIKPNIQVPDLDQLVIEVMETMTIKEFETQDHQGRWYQLQIRPYRTGDNKIDGAVIALLDIDSLKRNADELKNAMDDLKTASDDATTIIESQPGPLLVIDSDQRIKLANQVFYEKFKVSRTETVGRLVSELGHEQWKIPRLHDLITKTLSEGTSFDHYKVESDFPHLGLRTMLVSCRKVQLSGSRQFVALLSIEDVTEKLAAEIALKTSEERYRNLVASSYLGIIIMRNDIIEFANPILEKMFGYGPGQLVGKKFSALIPGRDNTGMGEGIKLTGRKRDGTEFPVDVSLIPYKSNSDIIVNCTVRDISELKQLEEDRKLIVTKEKALRAEAERANKIKDEFLATLSHELRTPLSSILSWAQLLRSGRLDSEKSSRGLGAIEQSAKAQSQLIDDLLDISRIQAGKLNLAMQKIDPSKVISAAVDSVRSLAATRSIQVETNISPSVESIIADPTRLQQILWNLITNAIKFSPQGGKVWVTLNRLESPSGNQIQIQVRDNGKGIKAEFIPIIFERFTQVDSTSTRTHGGLGLGLAIVRNLVEMHNGSVEVESAGEDRGTTFTILLPESSPEVVNTVEPSAESIAAAETVADVSLEGLRVLLVDDDASARDVFAITLQSFGAEVRSAESASEAFAIINEFVPNVLVSDIAMPGEDGYSLIGKIRSQKSKVGQVPAIALTAYAGREDVQRAHRAGFQAHLAKPVDAKSLAMVVARLAGRKPT
jgi:two-component system, chemotaxis family, CheB/CheR fusion protein